MLRRALPGEAELLTGISIAAFHTDYLVGGDPNDGPPDYDSAAWHEQMRLEGHLYAFEEGGRLAGGAVLFPKGKELYIGRVFIAPELMGRGLGLKLMKQAEALFPEAGIIKLDTPAVNTRTNPFYKKLGYAESGRDADCVTYEKKRPVLVTLRERPELNAAAAEWFCDKWGVPSEAYLECIDAYISGETEYGWYLCVEGDKILGGLGVIDNDFHEREDLTPNICAVYTEPDYRGCGIAGRLLDFAVNELRAKGISPVYLITDHTAFYERYGWEYFCDAKCDGGENISHLYIHR